MRAGAGTLLSAGACVFVATALAAIEASAPLVRPEARRPSYAEGAPPGFSGGFGEQSCHACHFDQDVGAEPGGVTITGVPAQFQVGERYSLTISVQRPGVAMGGFQLTARAAGGAQAGTLAPGPGEEARVAIQTQDGIQYANQRRAGTTPASDASVRWTVIWTAPETAAGAVLFHVSANAADADESVYGDYVYTASEETRPAQ